jgi:hypothetical protein
MCHKYTWLIYIVSLKFYSHQYQKSRSAPGDEDDEVEGWGMRETWKEEER